MWRAMFVALGLYCCILGVECLLIDKAVLAQRGTEENPFARVGTTFSKEREIEPPDWAPWSLMSTGAVTMLYSFTIPKRAKE